MTYKIVTDSIEIRGSEDKSKPRYVIKGTAAIANKKHTYEYSKNSDGSYKTLKSVFTPHCVKSIQEQCQHKKIFVDTQHELVRHASIKSLTKDKLNVDEQKQLKNMLDRKELPLLKFNSVNLFDDRLDMELEMNPMFREVSEDYKNYFDAVWYSLENKYLNGISLNFGDFSYVKDDSGDTVIDDVEVLGASILDGAAEFENNIYDVAIRSLEEGIHIREGELKMEEEKAKLENERKELEAEKTKLAEEKKVVEDKKAEEAKQVEIIKQKSEQDKIDLELEEKTKALADKDAENKKLQEELSQAKGVVKEVTPPSQPTNNANPQVTVEQLKEITKEHDRTMEVKSKGQQPMIDGSMKGFGELANLQSRISPTAGMDSEAVDFIKKNRSLDKGKADVVVPKLKE